MAKRGGYPGGMGMPGNMNNLMKQAQRMQRQMEEKTKEIEAKEKELCDLIRSYTNDYGSSSPTRTYNNHNDNEFPYLFHWFF